ncbi:MAG: hypothetical protein AB1486_05305 [Planctomycetota bacterium]
MAIDIRATTDLCRLLSDLSGLRLLAAPDPPAPFPARCHAVVSVLQTSSPRRGER